MTAAAFTEGKYHLLTDFAANTERNFLGIREGHNCLRLRQLVERGVLFCHLPRKVTDHRHGTELAERMICPSIEDWGLED